VAAKPALSGLPLITHFVTASFIQVGAPMAGSPMMD
jgi:hypothetical protein